MAVVASRKGMAYDPYAGIGSSATSSSSGVLATPSDDPLLHFVPVSSGSGSSAASVAQSSLSSSQAMYEPTAQALTAALDRIYQITEQNTARSEAQAAELRDWQERQNRIAMDFNSAEAAKNRDWQKMMSDTAHQREVADLQAAGLNPVLSAMGGNGASVGSGATASGYTSSGAKGEVDTSMDMALVNLLGTLWSAQTQIEMQRASAENNLAIADRNAAASELVARIYTEQSREASQLAAATSLRQSEISSAVSELVSRVSASAQYYSADVSRQNAMLYTEADKVVAQMNVDASKRNTLVNGLVDLARSGISFVSDQLSSKRASDSALSVAQENHKNSMYGSAWLAEGQLSDFLSSLFGRSASSLRGGGFTSRTGSASHYSYSQK